ncbi:MAG: 50S ribosomal protein L16 [Patescibacteria group bacterium]
MLQPKKVKHRKWQKGRSRNTFDTRGTTLAFGSFGLKATEPAWITSRQIEACRRAITHHLERGGKIWIRVFPDKPVTQKPAEVTMGGGKGGVTGYVTPVKVGKIMFEIEGVPMNLAKEALRLAAQKLPIKTRFVKK